jgi:hypothetical protein
MRNILLSSPVGQTNFYRLLLSSGSIITCGQTVSYDEEKSYDWLLKIIPEGCIDTLFCNPIVATPPEPIVQPTSVRIYPNPASNHVIFSMIPQGVSHLEIINL